MMRRTRQNEKWLVPQNDTKPKGFTLIELLVVIAIIAILAAILFPVFARARENARRASCQSNLKQIALGLFQYTQDYDEKYPNIEFYPSSNGKFANNYTLWAEVLDPYLKSTQIWYCPSNTVTNTPKAVADVAYSAAKMSYGAASDLSTGYAFSMYPSQAPSSLAQFNNVAETIMLADRRNTGNYGYFVAPSGTGGGVYGTESSIHLEGGNYAFADGHVKWLRPTAATATVNGTAFYYWLRIKP
jgi:prepilin-type N-terminal cleavage/methylation domain-containing protein/prepilin-type processing-associated H-X9-DG protein